MKDTLKELKKEEMLQQSEQYNLFCPNKITKYFIKNNEESDINQFQVNEDIISDANNNDPEPQITGDVSYHNYFNCYC